MVQMIKITQKIKLYNPKLTIAAAFLAILPRLEITLILWLFLTSCSFCDVCICCCKTFVTAVDDGDILLIFLVFYLNFRFYYFWIEDGKKITYEITHINLIGCKIQWVWKWNEWCGKWYFMELWSQKNKINLYIYKIWWSPQREHYEYWKQ